LELTEYGAAANSLVLSKEDERNAALALRARQGDYDDGMYDPNRLSAVLLLINIEELILEQLARNRVFLTDEGLEKLRSAFIIVVGCGGVGSHAAAALVRSGCSKIRLIDFDQVTLSSLNRHAVATLSDVGTPKVHAIRKRLQAIAPWVHFDCRNELFSASSAKSQLEPFEGQNPDFVIDAIDNIDSKVELLHYCHRNSIRVISSMGAGAKSDPSRIFIGDISTTTDDPLSKSTRVKLRYLGVKQGIPVVFSSEKWVSGKAGLLPLPEEEFEKGNVTELGVLQNFRVRIMPVLGTMPAIFGLAVANHVMLEISGYPHEYLQAKSRERMYAGILATLQGQEERLVRHSGHDSIGLRLPISAEDVGYLIDEIFRGKSVISGLGSRLVLIRWKKPMSGLIDDKTSGQKLSTIKLSDLVCMTKEEGVKHERLVLNGDKQPEEVYDKSVLEMVDRRFEEEGRLEGFR
jgi:tRNA threonylcarbamoyladenosine dehydratase